MKKSTAIAVSIAATAVVTAALSGLIAWIAWPSKDRKVDLGDLPTWISAVVALLALIGLGVTVYFAYKAFTVSAEALRVSTQAHETSRNLLEVELERDQEARQGRRDRDAAERRAQADRVAAWFGIPTLKNGTLGAQLAANVKNASDLPVYDVDVIFSHIYTEHADGSWEANPQRVLTRHFRVIPPQIVEFASSPPDLGRDVGGVEERLWVIGVRFRDAAGVRWERDPHGKLTELASS